ncbi:YkgJ family cysteine cluster protein [Parablautia muri]|uniref:YkgJ family cysteine cluster protein n=1 Tax=Parablautia muri TaxID=2320879 RepID=A0A9X5BEL7_9FIRM|nr:YkgJ family cysteine cluster protein [Parablautia muri]NBJ92475.1 YkgJ family cysteine cluster protein [Parablautia muri]
MEREIDLKEISDGRLYGANDMVKAGCNECAGCFSCCQGMGNSIILDPYDIYNLETGLGTAFEELMENKLELNVVDGIIQPNLKMQEGNDCCAFLSGEGRCAIHGFRPGFCRMFPLGRIYEGNDFCYFLQVHECIYPNKTKVKVKKWLEIPELGKYEAYIKDWHFFLKDAQKIVKETENEAILKSLNMYLLKQFYVRPYEDLAEEKGKGFYQQFYRRLEEAKEAIQLYR